MPDLDGKAGLSMQNIFIGSIIKQRRKELKLTQERLCDGICDPVSLSRIENGKQMPSRSIMNALLQRLGLPDTRYYALSSKHELEIEALKKEIVGCNVTRDVQHGFEQIERLKNIVDADDRPTQQFILRSKAVLGALDKQYGLDEQIQLLMDAIHLTIPEFDLNGIEQWLYSFDELKTIIQIANVYSNFGNNEQAANLFEQLLRYTRQHHQEIITSGGLSILILYNYARVLDLSCRYAEGAEIAKEGRDSCIKYGHYQTLPGCLEVYAECCYHLGKTEESAEAYHQAYYLCKLIGRKEDIEITKAEAKKYLNIEFQ